MDHRLFAVLAIVSFALEGAGCASETQRARREQVLMPLQTGSTIQRRVMVERQSATKKSKKKKETKETKRTSPTPAPAPTPEPSPQAEEENTTPDRFR
jgi:lipoprotein NlpI